MKRVNKRGQQMTLPVIIGIILGILVLVFLIFGFSTGWNNLWSKIKELGGGGANVDDIVRGCEVACAGQNTDAFCRQVRTIDYGNSKTDKGSCQTFVTSSASLHQPGVIKSCGSIDCAGVAVPTLEHKPEATIKPEVKEEKK